MRFLTALFALLSAALGFYGIAQAPTNAPVQTIVPVGKTDTVSKDPDDPAVWVNKKQPERSLLLGTNKTSAKDGGALYVFDLNGKTRQVVKGLDRPNNVDVEYGLMLGVKSVDIAVVTERLTHKLRVYRIAEGGSPLTELAPGGLPVFAGEYGEAGAPMGIALYKRPKDGAIFAIVGRKTGPSTNYLWQYRLRDNGAGTIVAEKVRAFGGYSGKKEIEAIAVDDALGYVYYADEQFGIHKWYADPDHKNADKELALFATRGFVGDHEGIGVYAKPDGTGYIVCSDQIPGNTRYHVFKREGEKNAPHDHAKEVAIWEGGADETDGLETVSVSLGPKYPRGLLVVMNSGPKNFLIYNWTTLPVKSR